jgi:hypothetical protein
MLNAHLAPCFSWLVPVIVVHSGDAYVQPSLNHSLASRDHSFAAADCMAALQDLCHHLGRADMSQFPTDFLQQHPP